MIFVKNLIWENMFGIEETENPFDYFDEEDLEPFKSFILFMEMFNSTFCDTDESAEYLKELCITKEESDAWVYVSVVETLREIGLM